MMKRTIIYRSGSGEEALFSFITRKGNLFLLLENSSFAYVSTYIVHLLFLMLLLLQL